MHTVCCTDMLSSIFRDLSLGTVRAVFTLPSITTSARCIASIMAKCARMPRPRLRRSRARAARPGHRLCNAAQQERRSSASSAPQRASERRAPHEHRRRFWGLVFRAHLRLGAREAVDDEARAIRELGVKGLAEQRVAHRLVGHEAAFLDDGLRLGVVREHLHGAARW